MGQIIDVGESGAASSIETVATFASLPSPPPEGIGASRVTSDTGVLYIWDGAVWNAAAGGGSIVGATNVGTGTGLSFKDVLGGNLRFRSIGVDASIGLTAGVDTISLSVASAPNVTGVVAIANGGTGQSNQQAGLNNITNIAGGSNGDILTISGGNALWAAAAAAGVSSFNTRTGAVTLTTADITAALAAPANVFLFTDPVGEVVGYSNWQIDPDLKFSNVQLFYQPNNLAAAPQAFNWNVNVDPLQNSPNDSLTVFNISANIDSAATGFNMGTAGNSVTLLNSGFNAGGNGSTYGRLVYQNWNTGFGNGTDPITFKGLSGIFIGWNAAANVTVDGQYSGYASSVSMDAASISTANFSVNGFSETSQLQFADVYGYSGFISQPTIGTIKNTHHYNGLTINPSITTMEGNSGYFGAIISGAITNQGTNGYFGVQVNPTITHLTSNSYGISVNGQTTDGTANWQGCFLSSNNIVTTGDVRVLDITTADGHTAIDSNGHHSLNVGVTLANGLGQFNGNIIGGQVTIPNGTAITSTDFFGNNLAFGVNLGDGTSSFTSSSPVGISSVGFVGQVIGDGTADLINFLLNGYSGGFNGNIQRINNTHNACFPNSGTGTLAESVLMLVSQPAGPVGTDNWGFRAESDHLENYMSRLAIGTTNKKVSSSIIGIDSAKTVQAIVATTDSGNSAAIFNSSSHTTVDGSNTTIGINGVASGVVDVGATNDKTVSGMNFVVGRQSGTDDGTLQNMTGANVLIFNQSGAAGITVEEVGYDLTTFAFSGTVTDLYDFRSTHVPAGGTITNHYGIYIKPGAAAKKNWLSGRTQFGASSFSSPNTNTAISIDEAHIGSRQATPPVAVAQAGAGTGASAVLAAATDIAGNLELDLGTLTLGTGAQVVVTFDKAYAVAPIVVITPNNGPAAANAAAFGVFVTSTITDFTINFATAGVALTTLKWNYQVIETL